MPKTGVFSLASAVDGLRQNLGLEHRVLDPSSLNSLAPPDIQARLETVRERHGSKLHKLCWLLQCDPQFNLLKTHQKEQIVPKAVVFVQWAELRIKALHALHDAGVLAESLTPVKIPGKKQTTTEQAVASFQDASSPVRVLVLTLTDQVAGLNLQHSCGHVILLHPMNSSTPAAAVSNEMQALGRGRAVQE
eukprot:g5032.t1